MKIFPKTNYQSVVSLLTNLNLYENRTKMYLGCFKKYVEKSNVLIDIGCGSGVFSRALDNGQRLIVQLDIDRKSLRTIKNQHVESICGDAQCLPMRDNSIDCVIAISVMEHLAKPSDCAKEVHRILKSKAVMIVQLPNLQYLFEPHSKWPLLFVFPKKLQSKILQMIGYAYINMNVTIKQAVKILINEGLKMEKSLKLYHLKIMKILPIAPSYIFVFKKS